MEDETSHAGVDTPERQIAGDGHRHGSAPSALDRVARLAARSLRAPAALVALIDGGRPHLLSRVGSAGGGTEALLDLCGRIAATGRPLAIEDFGARPLGREDEPAHAAGIVACAGVPIEASAGELLGAVCVLDTRPREWTDDDIELLRELAAQAVAELELRAELRAHRQAVEELRARGERYRSIFERADIGIVVGDPAAREIECNPAFREMIGASEIGLIDVARFTHPDDYAADATLFQELMAGERDSYQLEKRFIRQDGGVVWGHLTLSLVRDERGGPHSIIALVEDVSELKKAEEALERRNAILEAVGFAAERLLKARDWEEQIEEVLRHLGEAAGASRVYLFENHPGGAGEVLISQRYDWTAPGIVSQLHYPELQSLPLKARGYGRWLEVLGRGETIQGHVRELPESEREMLASHDIRSLLVVPVFVGGEWWGLIGYDECVAEREWSVAETEALRTAARTLGAAVERKQVEESARQLIREQAARAAAETAARRMEFLAEASSLLASSLDYQATLTNLTRLIVPTLADWSVVYMLEENGQIRRLEVAAADPSMEEGARALLRRFPLGPNPHHPVARVIRTGVAELLPEVPSSLMAALAEDGEHLSFLQTILPRSHMIVPLVARGHTLGAILLVCTGSARRYGPGNLALAEELARIAALALDNARLYKSAVAANQAKSDFLGVMSHELRTPLTAIITCTDLLETEITGPLTHGQKEHLGYIIANALHLVRLIEQILAFSRMEAGKDEVHPERVELGALAREAATLIEPIATERGLRFHVCAPEDAVEVETDPGKLRQILLNLLSNAVKFTERGEVRLDVRMTEAPRVLLRVRDTGIGIAPQDQEKIFEAFWQAERADTRRAGGAGLGLSVARRLAHLLGGEIAVESTPGAGSTFTVELPLAVVATAGD